MCGQFPLSFVAYESSEDVVNLVDVESAIADCQTIAVERDLIDHH